MKDDDLRSDYVGGLLERLKNFTDHISGEIGRRGRDKIHSAANHGLAVQTQNPEYVQMVALEMLKRVKRPDYLAQKLVKFGDYFVTFNIFYAALYHEAHGKKSFWKFRRPLAFRDEEKEYLINFLLSDEHKMRVFLDIRQLLCLASAISYECQKKLYTEYMILHSEFTSPADFLRVYEMWRDVISPDLREKLHELMLGILGHSMMKVWRGEKSGSIDVIEKLNSAYDPDSGSNSRN